MKLTYINSEEMNDRSTDAGTDFAGMGQRPIWTRSNVIIKYENAFGKEVVDIFNVGFKNTDEGAILDCSALTTLQFFVPASWADVNNVPFEVEDGRHLDLPKAGFGGTLRQVLERGTSIGIVTKEVQAGSHLDYLGEDFDEL
jgi:hypothetical protein